MPLYALHKVRRHPNVQCGVVLICYDVNISCFHKPLRGAVATWQSALDSFIISKRHCEKRSDDAICCNVKPTQPSIPARRGGLFRLGRCLIAADCHARTSLAMTLATQTTATTVHI